MKLLLIGFVRLYQIAIAPILRLANGGHGHCRHDPTCSNYALEALKTHGAIKGSFLAARRLLRCHPWGTHGYDPVPPAKSKIADEEESSSHKEPCLCCGTETSSASQNHNSPAEKAPETNDPVQSKAVTDRSDIA